jgi:hypothetical protein
MNWIQSHWAKYNFKNKWILGADKKIRSTRTLQFARSVYMSGVSTRMDILYLNNILSPEAYKHAVSSPEFRHSLRGQHSAVFSVLTDNDVIAYDAKLKAYIPGSNMHQFMDEARAEKKSKSTP